MKKWLIIFIAILSTILLLMVWFLRVEKSIKETASDSINTNPSILKETKEDQSHMNITTKGVVSTTSDDTRDEQGYLEVIRNGEKVAVSNDAVIISQMEKTVTDITDYLDLAISPDQIYRYKKNGTVFNVSYIIPKFLKVHMYLDLKSVSGITIIMTDQMNYVLVHMNETTEVMVLRNDSKDTLLALIQ